MIDNHFDLAAALMSDAADLVGAAPHGAQAIDDHAYGPLHLAAAHRATADDGHAVLVWAAEHDRILAAVEATSTAGTEPPAGRIVAFRAAGLVFTACAGHTFAAHGRRTYALTATTGTDTWQLTVDDATTSEQTALDAALERIASSFEATTG